MIYNSLTRFLDQVFMNNAKEKLKNAGDGRNRHDKATIIPTILPQSGKANHLIFCKQPLIFYGRQRQPDGHFRRAAIGPDGVRNEPGSAGLNGRRFSIKPAVPICRRPDHRLMFRPAMHIGA
jgi:hypothetical protein